MEPPGIEVLGKVLEGVVKATFGPGTIGRIGTVMIAALVCLSAVILALAFTKPLYAIIALGGVALLLFYFLHRVFNFADRNPGYAAMDGAQITRHMMRDVGMKQISSQEIQILDAAPVGNPQLPHLSENEVSDEKL